MPKKLTLNLEDLAIDSFETAPEAAERGTVHGRETEAFYGCPEGGTTTGGGGGTGDTMPAFTERECTWYPHLTCYSNQIAFPSECTGCGVDCNPTYDWCVTNGPGYNC